MGVHFRPGGAFPFLGVSPAELSDRHLNLEALWGKFAVELRERLCEARTAAERFSIMEKTLYTHLSRPLEHHYVVSAALDAFEKTGARLMVREMAKQIGISQRCLIQVFANEVGITPKLFSRIQRFQRAVAVTNQSSAAPDWAQLAATCGYFDQAHLIDDFVAFSGFTPTAYVQQLHTLHAQGAHRKRNHLPLPR
jgi:transcriptional regulator GlxA family with amidase domain